MKCRKKTASLRISLSLLAVLLLIMNCAAFTACSPTSADGMTSDPAHPQAPSDQETPTNKITYYYYSGNTMLSTADASIFEANVAAEDKVEVVFRLNYAIPECDCKKQISQNSTKEEIDAIKQAHRDKLKELHTAQNNKFVADNNLSSLQGDYRLIVPEYSPFIFMLVDSYTEYQRLENQILACVESDLVSSASIGLPAEYEPSAIRREGTDSPLYPLSQAISDINVSDQIYDGSGIPVGIIELGGITWVCE